MTQLQLSTPPHPHPAPALTATPATILVALKPMPRNVSRRKQRKRMLALAVPVLVLSLAVAGCSWETKVLSVQPPAVALSSFIYDKDGNEITFFRGEQHRVNVESLDEVPRHLQNAVIAIEDERFWQHSGIDLRAILRAARSNLNEGGVSEGGSTITQQYVGLVFLDRTDQSASRKLEELNLAREFERQYTKEFILTEYLNLVYFGEGAYGVRAAADEYFNKELNQLTISEAAILAGLIQAPSTYNPYNNLDAALQRRRQVLDRMLANGFITQKQYDQARTEPVSLAPRVQVLNATYEAPYFVEDVRQWILTDPRFGATSEDRETLLFEGGLRIYTTVDMELQRGAEAAIAEVLTDPAGPTAAVVVIENDTGYIRALVGGKDFFSGSDDDAAKFNLATHPEAKRQAGSAFKPFILAAALEQGMQLATEYPAPEEITIPIVELDQDWEVEGGPGGGVVTLAEATIRSHNTVFAQLMEDIGPEAGVEMAARLGVESPLEPVLSAVLGTNGVTVLDMATAFSTFARRGVKVVPAYVSHIVGPTGEVLYEHTLESERVLASDIADQVTDVLRQAVDTGTGRRAQLPGIEAAGKTGTAENFRDATFSGYTSDYTTSVWVGFPQAQIAMEPPTTPIEVFGGTYPAQIWQGVMTAAHRDVSNENPVREFPTPPVTTTTMPEMQETAVPDVVGLTAVQAETQVRDSRLRPYIFYIFDPSVANPQGIVTAQAPEGDSIVGVDEFVSIQVATSSFILAENSLPPPTGGPLNLTPEQAARLGGLDAPPAGIADSIAENVPVPPNPEGAGAGAPTPLPAP